MRYFVLATLVLAGTAIPAMAQDRAAVCELLPVKEDFVGAAYVGGVDVDGNPVVPADVKADADNFDVVRFPVAVDLAQQLNQPLPQGTEMKAPVAMIEIHKDGLVLYNGKDISSDIYALCGKTPFNIEKAVAEPQAAAPSAGQADAAAAQPEQPAEAQPEPAQQTEKEEIIWSDGN